MKFVDPERAMRIVDIMLEASAVLFSQWKHNCSHRHDPYPKLLEKILDFAAFQGDLATVMKLLNIGLTLTKDTLASAV